MTGEIEKRTAGAFRTLDEVLANLPAYEHEAKTKLTRVARVAELPKNPRILELGSASGGKVIAFQRLGCDCVGIDPNPTALKNAEVLFNHLGLPLAVREGRAEEIPFPDGEFDMGAALLERPLCWPVLRVVAQSFDYTKVGFRFLRLLFLCCGHFTAGIKSCMVAFVFSRFVETLVFIEVAT